MAFLHSLPLSLGDPPPERPQDDEIVSLFMSGKCGVMVSWFIWLFDGPVLHSCLRVIKQSGLQILSVLLMHLIIQQCVVSAGSGKSTNYGKSTNDRSSVWVVCLRVISQWLLIILSASSNVTSLTKWVYRLRDRLYVSGKYPIKSYSGKCLGHLVNFEPLFYI